MDKAIVAASAHDDVVQRGTISSENMVSLNNGTSFMVAVTGEQIFRMIADAVSTARLEVLIQTFAWEKNIDGVKWLNEALMAIAKKKATDDKPTPLKVYIQIDERGYLATAAFSGKKYVNWKLDADSIGLFSEQGLVEVYVSTFYHESIASNHGKTVVIDGRTLIITGANFQASNFHHNPSHDAAYMVDGQVALSGREDFVYMWNQRKNKEETPDISLSVDHLDTKFPEKYNNPIKVMLTTRLPQVWRRVNYKGFNFLDNPQNCAIHSLIENAKTVVKIATPNMNAPFIIKSLIKLVNRGSTQVQIMLGHSFNDKRESTIFIGGTNQATVDELYSGVDDDKLHNLDIRWYSIDGIKPVVGNTAGAAHLKFMAIDDTILHVGNANLDITSMTHIHEVNMVVESANITKYVTANVFTDQFGRSVKAEPSKNIVERLKHATGYKGFQQSLATKYNVKILGVRDEGEGFKTYRLERPDGFDFVPGQYINVRPKNGITAISPLQLAIASGVSDPYIEITARPSMLPTKSNFCLSVGAKHSVQIEGALGTGLSEGLSAGLPKGLTKGLPEGLLLVGGGSGIAPLKSVKLSVSDGTQVHVVYSTKWYKGLLYKEDIREWIKEGHAISLTQEKKKNYDNRRVTQIIQEMDNPHFDNKTVFICGPVPLIKDVRAILINKGVDLKNIYTSMPIDTLKGGPVYRGDHPIFN